MKKTFVVFTEQGRVKGKITAGILKKNDKFDFIREYNYSIGSNQGIKAEAIKELVKLKELPKEALDKSGYPNYLLVNELAEILIIEGRGLNYYSTL